VDERAGRRSAYAEVLAGLRDLADDGATQRFDRVVDDLLAQGQLTDDAATALRYWQRESLRNQADHLVTTASTALEALDLARQQTHEATSHAEAIWSTRVDVGAPPPPAPDHPPTEDPTSQAPLSPDAPPSPDESPTVVRSNRGRHRAAPVRPPTMERILEDLRDLPRAMDVEAEAPTPADVPTTHPYATPDLTQDDVQQPATSTLAPPERLFAPIDVTPPTPVTTTRRIEVPLPADGIDVQATTASAEPEDEERGDVPAARRRRLLVAGLTVMGDEPSGPTPPWDNRPQAG
jgi:hypothetical protein